MAAANRGEIETFLFLEARLLDERRFTEWEALWTDDGVYWVPAEHGAYDPERRASIIYDNRSTIAKRVQRLVGPDAFSEQPAAHVRRTIGNVELSQPLASGDVVVESNFVATSARHDRHEFWGGRITHHLRRSTNGLRMAYKRVELVNCDAFLPHLPFLP